MFQAFRKMSRKYHPDKAGGSTEAFQRVAEAHEVLSNPNDRATYDEGKSMLSARRKEDNESAESYREEIEKKYFPGAPAHPRPPTHARSRARFGVGQ